MVNIQLFVIKRCFHERKCNDNETRWQDRDYDYDSLDINSSSLRAIRGATPPKRNTFSHANRTRDSRMAEALYWQMVAHLLTVNPSFGTGKFRSGYLRRCKTAIHAVDSTTIRLVANCMDWGKHRRRKAAAKSHMNLYLQTMLPRYAVVDTAAVTDNRKAREVCGVLQNGDFVGYNQNVVQWQVWLALLTHLLMRFLAHLSRWKRCTMVWS